MNKKRSDKPKVFADRHHNSLYNSLRILLEERMGGELYTQVGMEWAELGYWDIYDHPATRAQFLSLDQRYKPIDGSRQLNQIVSRTHDWYELLDPEYNKPQKAMTFEQFMRAEIDILIASVPQHIEPFYRLSKIHPCKPKTIYQVGNSWDIANISIRNIMASAAIGLPNTYHHVTYHQEFDRDIFAPVTPYYGMQKNVYSFVNCFDSQEHFADDYRLFRAIAQEMPDWKFRAYGGQCRDGAINGAYNLAAKMREARFIWHTKKGGDGYGHIIHNAVSLGKPVLVKKEYYANKLASDLMDDGNTCIVIDGLSPQQIIDKIQEYSAYDKYTRLCEGARRRFNEVVNFDKEAAAVKQFIDSLI